MNRDIAIIGLACRFPDAANMEELFHNLKEGKDSLRPISSERIMATTIDPEGTYRVGGYLEDVDKFDHAFFNISLGEARTMDPHERIMLEVVQETFDNAACHADKLREQTVAIFVSDTTLEYYKHADEFQPTLKTGNVKAFLGAWISKQFNLTGNVMMIDTSCSSALVAVHMACNELLLGDADYALACGVNLDLFPYADDGPGLNLDSPDGKSRPFSKKANGMSFGEGAACLLLKPYDKAVADGNIIHAVIKGSAVNNNAARAVSLTAPDSITQAEVIDKAWRKAGIPAVQATFIEVHGSGTQLGDSIEIGGLDLFFKKHGVIEKTCAISTIKSNIGHTRSLAGIAGLVKAVLSLKHQVLFPIIGFEEANPLINFDNSPVFVIDSFRDWQVPAGQSRYAGVSSIGLSGTNCHLVLQEYIYANKPPGDDRDRLIPLSGYSLDALQKNIKTLSEHCKKYPGIRLEDMAFTLCQGRKHFTYRAAFVANSLDSLTDQLDNMQEYVGPASKGRAAKVILIFGDHSEVPRALIHFFSTQYPAFNSLYDTCMQLAGDNPLPATASQDFAFQYAFYHLLQEFGGQKVEWLTYGIGKLVRSVVKGELSLAEAVQQSIQYQAAPIEQIAERVEKLLQRETSHGKVLFVDMGIGGSLSEAIRQVNSESCVVTSLPGTVVTDPLLLLMGQLYEAGYEPAWHILNDQRQARSIELPAYQFDRTRCWLREQALPLAALSTTAVHGPAEASAKEGNFVERQLVQYWKAILPKQRITLEDNFFEIGGDSLKATKVIVRINEHFHTSLDFEDIFDYPTVKTLAALIWKSASLADRIAFFWKEVLQVEVVKAEDNFFELGGHSLNASQILNKIDKELQVALNFEDFYKHPTLDQLTTLIAQKQSASHSSYVVDIPKVPDSASYPLSHAQKRLWLLSQQDGAAVAYNQPEAYWLKGELMITALQDAFQQLIKRHESLRTTFHVLHGEPVQKIDDTIAERFGLTFMDLRQEEQQEERITQLFHEQATRPFDFEQGPLLSVQLLLVESDRYLLFLNTHHIISDEWSFQVMVQELIVLYNAFRAGATDPLSPLKIQYRDYCSWHNSQVNEEPAKEHEQFWKQQLSGELPVLNIPLNYPRPALKTYRGDRVDLTLDGSLSTALQAFSKREGASLYMVLLAAIKLLLHRYTAQQDIIIGCPVAGRQHSDLESQVGFYVNIIPFRTQVDKEHSFRALLNEVKHTVLQGFNHQVYPFDLMLENINIIRDPARFPLFDVGFSGHLDNTNTASIDTGFSIEEYDTHYYTIKADLWFHEIMKGDIISLALDYNTDLFTQDFAARMLQHLQNVLLSVATTPEQSISLVDYLGQEERQQVIYQFNETAMEYPVTMSIPALLEQYAKTNPDQPALVFGSRVLTYGQLNEQANRQAHHLVKQYDIQKDMPVALFLQPGDQMVVAIFAVLKAGGAYVPIDPEYPAERIKWILTDASPKVVITQTATQSLLPDTGATDILNVDEDIACPASWSRNLVKQYHPNDLAYIIYTSGSTGKPKGVAIEHRSVVKLVTPNHFLSVTPADRVLQLSNYAFDGSVLDIFGALLNGATLWLIEKRVILSFELLMKCFKEQQINIVLIPTALFNNLVDYDPSFIAGFDKIYFGGEKASVTHLKKALPYRKKMDSLVNAYGPTEGTVVATSYIIHSGLEQETIVPIGTPISNTQVYILDADSRPVGIGVEGEICIAGDGLARGYWNNEPATMQRFVWVDIDGNQKRIYQSGDMARWTPDGKLEFLGRKDKQVKVRGHRIELDEISHLLQLREEVENVHLLLKENKKGDKDIIAYLVIRAGTNDKTDYRAYLEKHLPLYMIPASFVLLDTMPLTANGKVDTMALLQKTPEKESDSYQAPASDTERLLAAIWEDELGQAAIGMYDNYFVLGGDSIKAIRVVNKINAVLGKRLEVKDIYLNSDIASLAGYLATREHQLMAEKALTEIKFSMAAASQRMLHDSSLPFHLRNTIEDIYPMSDVQKGMVFHSLKEVTEGVYHDQLFFQFKDKDFSLDDFRHSVGLLVKKHALLRTSFHIGEMEGDFQAVHSMIDLPDKIAFQNISHLTKEDQQQFLHDYVAQDRAERFNVAAPGLWRMVIFNMGGQQYGLLWVIHHAMIDGWSNASFITELSNLYFAVRKDKNTQPEILVPGYKDYLADQLFFEQHYDWKEFWLDQLNGFQRTNLPLRSFFAAPKTYTAVKETSVKIGESLSKSLNLLATNLKVSAQDIFLAAFSYLLKVTTNTEDVLFGLVTNGRPAIPDGDKMIGCFLNTIPFRSRMTTGITGKEIILATHASVSALKQFDKISLYKITSAIRGNEPENEFALFNTTFAYLDFYIFGQRNKGLELQESSIGNFAKTNTTLDFVVNRSEDHYIVSIVYNSLYTDGEIARLLHYYENILSGFALHLNDQLNHSQVIGGEEMAALLQEPPSMPLQHTGMDTIQAIFESRVAAYPQAVALVFSDHQLTYRQLNEQANQVAHLLQEKYGLKRGDIVALLTDRTAWSIIALMGIIKAGACYLPIDIRYPAFRKQYLLADSRAEILVSTDETDTVAIGFTGQCLVLNKLSPRPEYNYNPVNHNEPSDLAYIIYTSGSTGNPKGVLTEHRNMINIIQYYIQQFSITSADRTLQFASLSFDASVLELFLAFFSGAGVVMLNDQLIADTGRFETYIAEKKGTVTLLPPPYINTLQLDKLSCLRVLMTGGEAAIVKDTNYLCNLVQLYNVYGPTESTILATDYRVLPGTVMKDTVPLGKPLANTHILILDKNGEILPQGVEGEICISGAGLARGYLNQPGLTAQKFIPHPYKAGERIYKTGDLGFLDTNGNIEFTGRNDSQVKVNGHRIELGEIEAVLKNKPEIRHSLVLVKKEEQHQPQLVAYFISAITEDIAGLREFMARYLPLYMIPGYFVQISFFPLNNNGKIDVKQLPDWRSNAIERTSEYTAPDNETEEKIAAIWRKVLKKDQISVDDNYFELGGDSMKMIQVFNLLKKEHGFQVEIADLFKAHSIRLLSQLIQKKNTDALAPETTLSL